MNWIPPNPGLKAFRNPNGFSLEHGLLGSGSESIGRPSRLAVIQGLGFRSMSRFVGASIGLDH